MNSRERIQAALAHREPDRLPVDFGGGMQTGMAASVVYALRQALGLDRPGTPVRVIEPYQMLGEIAPDLQDALGLDAVSLAGTGTMFGFPLEGWKEWRMPDGTPALVPGGFNTDPEPGGDLLQHPEGDRSCGPCARMPAGGHFFDAIIRQEPLDDASLRVEDNLEEFGPVTDAALVHYAREAERLRASGRAVFATFGGLTFGDVALVPATWLRRPKGIRDVEEWYVSTATRPDFIKAVFDRQAGIAVANLERLHAAVGDRIDVIQTNGTDFGTQRGPFCSPATYRDLYLPFQKRVNGWIHAHTPWKTFMHCCGGVVPLLDLIVEAEFDILNPVQCSAAGMEPAALKRRFGSRLVFWGGGVDTQKTLPFGTPDQVREEVTSRIETFAPGGGFVFNAVHNVVANTPIANVLAMLETVKRYR
jgi:hypothetical protein